MKKAAVDRKAELPPGLRRLPLVGAAPEPCIFCNGTQIRREGRWRKKLEIVQLWYCVDCGRVFTPQRDKGKQFPLRVVLDAVITPTTVARHASASPNTSRIDTTTAFTVASSARSCRLTSTECSLP